MRGEKNIILGNDLRIDLYAQLYSGIQENSGFLEIGDETGLSSHVMLNVDTGRFGLEKTLIGPNVVFRESNHAFERRDMIIQ